MGIARQNRRKTYNRVGLLKAKNQWGRFSEKGIAWASLKQEEGRDFHEKQLNRINDQLEEQLAVKLEALKITWKDLGYNQEEIDILEEAFGLANITVTETKAEDRKRAKKLNKQANNSRKARLNAGS
jgi:hypothetical protein